ncbi:MAG: hypothetical protein AB7V43_01230 [Acidimicrobiia bacterium]
MEHSTPDSRGHTPSRSGKVVLDQSAPARGAVPLRKVLGSTAKPKRSMPALGRAGWALVGVVCVAGAVGVVEVLFPETGPATAESVWQTPGLTKRQASVTTTIATADIDFDQVAADAALRTAESANSVTGATTGFAGAAPSSVLGTVVSAGGNSGSSEAATTTTTAAGITTGANGTSTTAKPSNSSTVTTRPSTTTPPAPATSGSTSTSPDTSTSRDSTTRETSTTRDTTTRETSTTRDTTTRNSTTSSTSTTKAADASDSGSSGSGGSGSGSSGKGSNGGGSNSGKG